MITQMCGLNYFSQSLSPLLYQQGCHDHVASEYTLVPVYLGCFLKAICFPFSLDVAHLQ